MFVLKIGEHYEYRENWHQRGAASELMAEYHGLLRSILEDKPHLERCRTGCRHCGIVFVADPRNAGREDLGCPFGCQAEHRRRESVKRSSAYYRDEAGKMKKKIQNEKRGGMGKAGEIPAGKPPGVPSEAMVEHLMMVMSAIEGRAVSREEVLEFARQRSIAARLGIGQDGARTDAKPP